MNTPAHASTLTTVRNHSLRTSLLLHLLPGAGATVAFLLLAPIGESLGVPSFLMLVLAAALLALPLELGILLWEAKRRNATLCLKGVVLFREPLRASQYVFLPLVLLVWVGFIAAVVNPPIESAVVDSLFSWVPDVYFMQSFADNISDYSRWILITAAVVLVLINGTIGPIVEELYFRGYLLPRISQLGWWAPLVNTVLFSFYHFFSPWQNPLRILAFAPVFYAVWWKKNIYIGIIVHCLGNLLGSVGILILVLRSA